eukprot:TRINITY_DN2276_c1_g1_i2.p2 TRINITY_DN2276_c1_g1~~TRINITY_DN2276_c1_g1_i2.p2  ORF type:complete len:373 (-),score=76.45 TRINITY_DN2276_c1_g1_i2:27-1055(-)
MGNYYFTSAADRSKTKVEYTFGYKKHADGEVRIFLHHSSVPYSCAVVSSSAPAFEAISESDVRQVQAAWACAIKSISKTYLDGGNYVAAATKAAGELYAYGRSNVLFKPTKAKDAQFRPTGQDAMSYFVGHKAVKGGYTEDAGFAINGGKGWSNVAFEVRIFLHHSSVPYSCAVASPTPSFEAISEDDVRQVQAAWACAIKNISKTYLDGENYVAAATKAAGELYAYGRSNVLFKPTKAKDAQFRPTGQDAMSYFVGHKAVKGGYTEDAGFAINGGKGWSNVAFDNHKIELLGDVAIAMGNYYFTSAQDGGRTKVEYTFGYKKCADGKVRIFLHHSSVPYSA